MSRPFTRAVPIGTAREGDDEKKAGNTLVARHADRGIGKRPEDHGRGRVCEADGCSTRLNRYNAAALCYQHDDTPFVNRAPRSAA